MGLTEHSRAIVSQDGHVAPVEEARQEEIPDESVTRAPRHAASRSVEARETLPRRAVRAPAGRAIRGRSSVKIVRSITSRREGWTQQRGEKKKRGTRKRIKKK